MFWTSVFPRFTSFLVTVIEKTDITVTYIKDYVLFLWTLYFVFLVSEPFICIRIDSSEQSVITREVFPSNDSTFRRLENWSLPFRTIKESSSGASSTWRSVGTHLRGFERKECILECSLRNEKKPSFYWYYKPWTLNVTPLKLLMIEQNFNLTQYSTCKQLCYSFVMVEGIPSRGPNRTYSCRAILKSGLSYSLTIVLFYSSKFVFSLWQRNFNAWAEL